MRNKSEALINELSEMEQILEEMACSHEKSQKDFEELRASFERFKLDLKKDD